jgi:tRNA G37 N-methylase Trm5
MESVISKVCGQRKKEDEAMQHSKAFMSLHSILQTKLPPEKTLLLPKAFEVIGDIAIISIPPALEDENRTFKEDIKTNNYRHTYPET